MEDPVSLSPPIVHALLVADQVFTEDGKWTLRGLFDRIWSPQYPVEHSPFWVYVALSSIRGEQTVEVRIVDAADPDADPIYRSNQMVRVGHPNDVRELGFSVSGIVFPRAGEYALALTSNGHPLLERRLYLLETPGDEE